MPVILQIIISIVLIAIAFFIYINGQRKIKQLINEKGQLTTDFALLQKGHTEKEQALALAKSTNYDWEKKYAVMETNFTNSKTQYESFLKDREALQQKFENLANRILEEKSNQFDQQQKQGIKAILEPLKEKIKTFEEKIEHTNNDALARNAALRQQITGLATLNERMSKEAVNLTRALKGDNKKQGNWGEIILESILEKSGLVKDREYFVQQSLYSDENRRQQPDVVINTPDEKVYIVDSKVSLKAYDAFVNTECPETAKTNLKAHAYSIKRHIDGLAEKKYHELHKAECPDFVFMFIPIETAFSSALSYNADLFTYAFEQNIIIVTPSTLLAVLKTVETLWRNDKQQRFALEIATEAGKMYDKFAAFVMDLESVGKRIDQTKLAWNDSMKKLTLGTGNLMTRAEKVKALGAKTNKQMPKPALAII